MTDDKHQASGKPERGETDSASGDNSAQSTGPGMQQVLQALIALNIGRKNVFSYPPEHAQIRQSMDRAYNALAVLLEDRPGVTLGITGDSLIVELLPPAAEPGRLPTILPIDPSHVACREMARIFKQTSVATITIAAGIDMDELYQFLTIIARPVDDIIDAGGITALAAEASLPSIQVRQVDYGRFHVTEEKEIVRDEKPAVKDQRQSLWETFVIRVMAGVPGASGKGVSSEEAGGIETGHITRHINENRLDAEVALDAFNRALSDYFAGEPPDIQALDTGQWGMLLSGLSPAIQPRFLSAMQDHLNQNAPSHPTAQLLASMPGHVVSKMLDQADTSHRTPSRHLLTLLGKMATDKHTWPDNEAEIITTTRALAEKATPSEKERRTPLMPPDTGEPDEATPLDLKEILPTLEDPHLDLKIARLLMGFMNGDIEQEEYATFADKLIHICEELLEAGNFAIPATVLNTFASHIKKKRNAAIREAAGKALQAFSGSAFATQAVNAFLANETAAGKGGVEFLTRLGPTIVPSLVKHYAAKDTPALTEEQQTLFSRFSAATSAEAQQRLDSNQPAFTRNLIVLLRTLKAREAVDRIRPFLNHDNQELQTETLETLLLFGDPVALSMVRKMINARQAERSLQGIALAGKHRVIQLVPDLVVKLKRFIIFKSDFQMNYAIITALSQIGQPEALPWLKKVAATSWPFYTREMTRMKVALFKSLKHYPPEAIQPLLIMGRDMRDKEISMACHALMQKTARKEA
ncbi:MAG: hypothetical protein SWH61_07180 [Thermodesulfobacteriota bacterium]|nr:hypothetical protein [Thermodesulfobacteriota bacterium]